MATENNKVGEEERAKELNLSYLHWLFPCSSPYWVSQSHFSWPPLTWQGPSFFLRRVCRVVNEAQGEFMSYVLEGVYAFVFIWPAGGEAVCMTCTWGEAVLDKSMSDTTFLLGQGQSWCYVRRLGKDLWPSVNWDRWIKRRRGTGWQQIESG